MRNVFFMLLEGVKIIDEFVSRLLLVGERSFFKINERFVKERLDI